MMRRPEFLLMRRPEFLMMLRPEFLLMRRPEFLMCAALPPPQKRGSNGLYITTWGYFLNTAKYS